MSCYSLSTFELFLNLALVTPKLVNDCSVNVWLSDSFRTGEVLRGGYSPVNIQSQVLRGNNLLFNDTVNDLQLAGTGVGLLKGGLIKWMERNIHDEWDTSDAGAEGLPIVRQSVLICSGVH